MLTYLSEQHLLHALQRAQDFFTFRLKLRGDIGPMGTQLQTDADGALRGGYVLH